MNYKDKEGQGAPDGFDTEQCPLYQWHMGQKDIKKQIKEVFENDNSKRHLANALKD